MSLNHLHFESLMSETISKIFKRYLIKLKDINGYIG